MDAATAHGSPRHMAVTVCCPLRSPTVTFLSRQCKRLVLLGVHLRMLPQLTDGCMLSGWTLRLWELSVPGALRYLTSHAEPQQCVAGRMGCHESYSGALAFVSNTTCLQNTLTFNPSCCTDHAGRPCVILSKGLCRCLGSAFEQCISATGDA